MQHPDEGTIHAWLDGQLPVEEATALESHASECAQCSAAIAEARGLIAASSRIVSALDVVPAGVIPIRKPVRRPWYANTQLRAAAAVVVVAGASMLVMQGRDAAQLQETVTQPATASKAAPQELRQQAPVAAPLPPQADGSSAPAVAAEVRKTVAPSRAKEMAASSGAREEATAPSRDETRSELRRDAPANVAAPAALGAAASAESDASRRAAFGTLLKVDPVVVTGVAEDRAGADDELKVVRTDSAGTMRTTVYRLAEGVEVTLTEIVPRQVPTSTALSDSRARAAQSGAASAKTAVTQASPSARPGAPPARNEAAAKPAPIVSINWIDSTTKRVYILSGPVSAERLEQLRIEIERKKR